jgi:membrane associated rhomboid family serine protease
VAAIGLRLASVFIRIIGIAAGMALIAAPAAVIALLAGVAAGWLVEMTLWTLRLVQERKLARA